MRCPECAHLNPREARFCESCGRPLDVHGRPRGGSGAVFYGVIAGLVIVIGLLVYQVAKIQLSEQPESSIAAGVQTTPAPMGQRPTFLKAERPVAHIEGFAPLAVKLKPLSFELPKDYNELSFKWEFSPGKTQMYNETRGRVSFTYDSPGVYRPRLLISDQAGEIARQTWEIYVLPPAASAAMQALEVSPHDADSNLAMAKVYSSIGAPIESAYYAFRSHLADPKDSEPIVLLSDYLETLLGMGEYVHYALRSASELEQGDGPYSQRLTAQIEGWKEDRDRQCIALSTTAGRPDSATSSGLILSLASLHDYEEAVKFIVESGLTEGQLSNLTWFSLNTGKLTDARSYAEKQYGRAPGDPYAVQYMMMLSALEGNAGKAREYLDEYISLDPERGHALTVAADAIMFTSKGMPKDFAWEICDELRLLM